MTPLDLTILLGCITVILALGLWAGQQNNNDTVSFFLAGRNMTWFIIGVSLFASNISSEHVVRLSGYGAVRGLAVGNSELLTIPFLMLLGWFFAPIFLKDNIFTVPEFFGRRFNNTIRLILSAISIAAYLLAKISVSLFASSLILHGILGWDIHASIIIILIITGIYTIIGGLRAVIYTSLAQAFLITVGAAIFTFIGLQEVNGLEGLQANLPGDYFTIFKPLNDPDFPWTGIVFGIPILAIYYWCTDQYIVQRILSARDVDQARRGSILTGFLQILPMFVLVVPGMIAAVLFPGINGDAAYATLVGDFPLPTGILGLVLAGVLAGLMSSLSTCFISTSTLFTMDFYRYFQPNADEEKLVLIGRLFTTFIVLLGVLGVPLLKLLEPWIYTLLGNVPAHIGPPIVAIFLLGIFWRHANSTGALWTLITGETLGLSRLGMMSLNGKHVFTNPLLSTFITMNFLHFAIFLFGCSVLVMICVSILTGTFSPPINENAAITRKTLLFPPKPLPLKYAEITGNRFDLWISGALIVIIIGLWGIFL